MPDFSTWTVQDWLLNVAVPVFMAFLALWGKDAPVTKRVLPLLSKLRAMVGKDATEETIAPQLSISESAKLIKRLRDRRLELQTELAMIDAALDDGTEVITSE